MPRNISKEDSLILVFIKAVRACVHVLPIGVSLAIGRLIGCVAYAVSKRRYVAYYNLKAAFGNQKSSKELRRVAFQSIQMMGMNAVELLKFPDLTKDYIDRHIEIEGREEVEKVYSKQNGIIFLTAHYGNWEMLNIAGALLGFPLSVLARIQRHPRSDEYLNGLRASKGSRVIYKGMMVREILKTLKDGGLVGILSDQDGGKNGVFVDFFGRQSSSPRGVSIFGQRTGAPVVPVFIRRLPGNRHRIKVLPRIPDAPETFSESEKEQWTMQKFAEVLERQIREAPEQWLWAHRRWKSTPDRFILILSDGKAGHLNQSLAVAEEFKNQRCAQGIPGARTHLKVVAVEYKSRAHEKVARLVTWIFQGQIPAHRFFMRLFLDSRTHDELERTYADLLISCGSGVLPAHALMKRETGAKSLVVMKPFCGTACFDTVIAPRHDKIKSSARVFETDKALGWTNTEILRLEGARLLAELELQASTSPRIGLLVGGDTEQLKFEAEKLKDFARTLAQTLRNSDRLLLATTSRRTPRWADDDLKRLFDGQAFCPLLVVANEANRAGVVPGILGACDTVIVSGESMSMLSEAVASGKRVLVWQPFDSRKMKTKYQLFLENLHKKGMLEFVDSENLASKLVMRGAQAPVSSPDDDKEVLRRAVQTVSA